MDDAKKTHATDEKEVTTDSSKTAVEILDFWAPWCGPCKIMSPILEEIKKEYKGRVTIHELNVDEEKNQHVVNDVYHIMSVPTYIFLKNGEVTGQLVGAQPKENLTSRLETMLADEAGE